MIIMDNLGHLVSDTSEQELHRFAHMIRLRREWFQTRKGLHPHYDLTTNNMIERARKAGAVQVTPQDLVRRAWWSGSSQDLAHRLRPSSSRKETA